MSETYPCSGFCGLRLDKPHSWCLSCTPKPEVYAASFALEALESVGMPPIDPKPTPAKTGSKTPQQLRMELWQAAFKLALGPIKERDAALETISHLVTVLQHTQHNPEKET